MEGYEVVLADSAFDTLMNITSRDDARRVGSRLNMLVTAPHFGEVYNPIYDSARPPHEVLATFAGHYGIYYTCDDQARKVYVEYLEDTRHDPMKKFQRQG